MPDYVFTLPVFAGYCTPGGHMIQVVRAPNDRFVLWLDVVNRAVPTYSTYSELASYRSLGAAIRAIGELMGEDYPTLTSLEAV